MQKVIRSVIAIAISYLVIYGISNVLNIETWWLSLIICFCCGYLTLYTERPYHDAERKKKQEYIIDLQNDGIGELFTLSKFPGYKIDHLGRDGNDYISNDGAIICTKYVEEKEIVKVREGGISLHIFCILICMFSFFLWISIIHTGHIANRIENHKEILIRNILSLKGNGMVWKILIKLANLLVRGGREIAVRFGKNAVELLNDIKNVF